MLLIPCPWCGERHEKEFTYGGDATVTMPKGDQLMDTDAWHDFVFMRDNTMGDHDELWLHGSGCGQWFKVRRSMTSNKIVWSGLPSQKAEGSS